MGGGGGVSGGNAGPLLCPPEAARRRRVHAGAGHRRLRPKLNAIPGIRTYLQNPPLVRIGGQVTAACISTLCRRRISTSSTAAADEFEKRMRAVPGLTDVNSDLQISSPQVIVDIDRDRASALGVTADQWKTRSTTPTARARFRRIYTSTNDY